MHVPPWLQAVRGQVHRRGRVPGAAGKPQGRCDQRKHFIVQKLFFLFSRMSAVRKERFA